MGRGETDIDLHVAGTLESPRLYGTVQVNDGTIKLSPIIDVFRNISTTVNFVGTQANIEKLSCRLGDGEVKVSGNVVFLDEQGSVLDLRLVSQGARVNTGMFGVLSILILSCTASQSSFNLRSNQSSTGDSFT